MKNFLLSLFLAITLSAFQTHAQFVATTSIPAGALNFDGINDYVNINNPFTAFNKEITVEWAANIDPSSGIGSGISQSRLNSDGRGSMVWMMHYLPAGNLIQFYISDNGIWKHADAPVPSGWHKYTGVASASAIKIYMDGNLIATSNDVVNSNILNVANSVINLGKDSRYALGRFMKGQIDEVRIWDRALCEGEIQNNNTGELILPQSGLLGYYKFNQGNINDVNTGINTLTDFSGNNNNGQLINFALSGPTSNWVEGLVTGTAPLFFSPSTVIIPNGPLHFCPSGSVTLSANQSSGFSYQWIKNGTPIPGANTYSYTANSSGNYNVIIYKNGCSSIALPQEVVVEDVIAPTFTTLQANVTVAIDAIDGTALLDDYESIALATDNCGGTVTIVQSPEPDSPLVPNVATTVTLKATDAAGNFTNQTFTVTATDQTAPSVITQNITVALDENGHAVITPAQINNGSTDNSGQVTLSLDKSSFDCSNINQNGPETQLVYMSPTNQGWQTWNGELGLEFNLSSSLIVNSLGAFDDNSDGINGGINGGVRVAIFDRNTRTIIPGLDVTIAGANDPLINNYRVRSITPVTLQPGSYAVVAKGYGANERNGNYYQIGTSDNANGIIQFVGGGIYGPSDNTSNINYPLTSDGGPVNRYMAGTFGYTTITGNTVILTVTDASGNSATGTAIVTVEDHIAPTIVSKPISVALSASGTVSIVANDVLQSGSDNCGTVTYTLSQDTFGATEATNGPVMIQLTGTDSHGNSTVVPVLVTVIDPLPVVITQNITVSLDSNGNVTISPDQIDNGSSSLVGLSGLTLDISSFDCSTIGSNTVTLTATSTLGSTASATATVTVQDNIAPGLTVPANIVQLNDAGVCGAVVNIGLATATDNCTVASVTSDAPAFFPVGITTVTWTALDVNANSTTGTQTVEITNNAPVISGLNVSALVQLGDATLASATHADNNLVGATWNWGDGSSTPALITGTNLSGNHVYGQTGLYDVTLTIEDACGKTDTETFSYVVIYNSCDGFITGGGYINTPAGAYAAKPTSTDKSEYEFEAKYHKGALAPKGEFKFKMHSGNFEVKSTSLDWLMVNNDQAILKGSASVNGQGGYQFIVSVLDGDITSKNGTDYLRLIVWDNTGNVLYDNQNGDPDKASASNPISKGQVVIHKPKNGNCFSDDEDENDKSSANSSDNSSDKNKSGNLEVVLTPVQMDMTVYPNPVVSAEVTISIEGFGNTVARIDLANLSGQQVYTIQSVKFQGGKAKTEFKQANLKSGNYLLRVTEINTSRFGVKQIIVSSKK